MKAGPLLGIAALVAQGDLVIAKPYHGNHAAAHEKIHKVKRDIVTTHVAVTEIVTVTATDDSVTVWVNPDGQIVSTQYGTPAPTTSTTGIDPIAGAGTARIGDGSVQAATANTPTTSAPADATSTTAAVAASNAVVSSATPGNEGTSLTGNVLQGFSVAYDAIYNGPCRNADADIAFLAGQGAQMIRIYGIGCPLGPYVEAAAKYNIKLMIGLNNIDNLNSDLNKLITMVTGSTVGWASVDTIYICNECTRSGKTTQAIAGAVSVSKGILSTRGFTGNVVCVETFAVMMSDATACSSSSYCAINAHPYFDQNTAADAAGSFVRFAVEQVGKMNPGKRVVVTEAGWPYAGGANGKAIASPDNQRVAMDSIMKEFASTPADVFLFQAWSAMYKEPGFLGVERAFGLFDQDHFDGKLNG